MSRRWLKRHRHKQRILSEEPFLIDPYLIVPEPAEPRLEGDDIEEIDIEYFSQPSPPTINEIARIVRDKTKLPRTSAW